MYSSITVALIFKNNKHFLKHNNTFLEHNKHFSKHNTVLTKHNKGLSKHNTVLLKHNTIIFRHNTIFAKHNTKFSRLRNAGFVTKQSMNPYLLNREHVTRLDCKLNSSQPIIAEESTEHFPSVEY